VTDHYWLGITIIVLGGIANGCFALPMKFSQRWRWENTWLVFSVLALLVLPWALLTGFVPHPAEVYRSAPSHTVLYPLVFGALWGIAQVTFGLSIRAIGIAVAFAVVQGLQTPIGSLIPLLVFHPTALFHPRGFLLMASLPVLFLGLFLYAVAGRRREKEQHIAGGLTASQEGSFIGGLAIAVFTGVFGANLNLGFAFGGGLIQRSLQLGANQATSTYCVWALVLGAGFVPNFVYCVFLMFRNGTWNLFAGVGWLKECILSTAMGVLWLGGILLYGIGATLTGKYGTSEGFVLLVASVVIAANVAGVLSGEWRSVSSKTKRILVGGITWILLSTIVLTMAKNI
jgi:L-rhamnose-H+ transport protein